MASRDAVADATTESVTRMPWVETERQSLVATLRATDPETPTLCRGWDTRRLLAHLVQREHDARASLGDAVARREPGHEKYLGRLVDGARTPEGYEALVSRFESGPPRWSPMSWAGENLNLAEYVIHHEDIRRGSGPVEPRPLPEDEAASLHSKATQMARLMYLRSPVGVSVARPGGPTTVVKKGADGVTLTGEPVELALYHSGRRDAAAVEVTGSTEALAAFGRWQSKS